MVHSTEMLEVVQSRDATRLITAAMLTLSVTCGLPFLTKCAVIRVFCHVNLRIPDALKNVGCRNIWVGYSRLVCERLACGELLCVCVCVCGTEARADRGGGGG